MVGKCFVLFFTLLSYGQASILDWFSPLSDHAKRAQAVMEGFDPVVERALKDYNVPGVAVGIILNGHLVYAKGFGYRDLVKKLPVTADTVFQIGSCTKAFTSFVMGTLVEEGMLHWDQLVVDIIPEFRLYDQYATQNLTLRDLLTHRTGMPRHDFMWYNSEMTRAEVIRRIRYLEPSCDLRERYQYNNLMYLAAGYAVEQLSKKSWESLVSDRILQPLRMTHTSFAIEEMLRESDFATPHIEKGGHCKQMSFRDISLIGPAGSMNSNVNDLARWVQMQLNGGTYENRPLVSPSTLQEMHTPQVIIPRAPETTESLVSAYGIGWEISTYRGHYLISHDGGVDGFTSVVALLPKQGVGVIVLANRNLTSFPRYLSLQAIDRVLELPFIDWLQVGLDGIHKSKESAKESKMREHLLRKTGTAPSHPLEQFVGEYAHPGYGIVSLALVDGKLVATFNGLTWSLDHWHYDVFVISEQGEETLISNEGTKIAFRSNTKGDIVELSIPLEPKAGDIVFVRKCEEIYSTPDYLRQFIGLYELHGHTVEIIIRNHALCAIIPGQPLYSLEPAASENEFTVKSMTGSTIRFILNGEGKVEEVLLVQPYGAFTAKPKR